MESFGLKDLAMGFCEPTGMYIAGIIADLGWTEWESMFDDDTLISDQLL